MSVWEGVGGGGTVGKGFKDGDEAAGGGEEVENTM